MNNKIFPNLESLFKGRRFWLVTVLILVLVGIPFIFSTLLIFAIYFIYPVTIILILHKVKIWKTKERLGIGALALAITAVLFIAIMYPVMDPMYASSLSSPHFSTKEPDKILAYTVSPYWGNGTESYSYKIISTLNSTIKLSIYQIKDFGSVPVLINTYFLNGSGSAKNNYTFLLTLSNLPSSIIYSNITQNGTYAELLGPILIPKSDFYGLISSYVITTLEIDAAVLFIVTIIVYLLIVFGVSVMRQGRGMFSR